MAESNQAFILKILEDLTKDNMSKLEVILNEKNIGKCKLENLNEIEATKLIMAHFETPLEDLKDILDKIPRKDLVIKINAKIEAAIQNKGEAQDNVTSEVINSCPGSSNHPTYTGKYTLFDLEDYATKNQDQLIMHLEDILEPDKFNELKKQLMCSVLNTFFSFTAQKYYELYINGEVKDFLKTKKKPKKIPMKLLNILFSKKKNHKRKVQEQMQREGNINLKKKRFVNINDDDDSVPDKVIIGIENEKKIPIPPIQHKPVNEDSNVIEEHGLGEDSRMATENRYEKNENEKNIPIPPIQHKPVNEDSNVIEEHGLGEDSRMATENRYEKNENEKKIPILPIQHKPVNEDSNVIEEHGLGEDSRMATENRYEKNENEKKIPIPPIQHKPVNEDSNVIEEHGLGEDSRMATENRYEKNENEKKIPILPIQHKPVNEDSNVIEEHGLGEDSRMATENRYEKNENEKKIPIPPIQHKPVNEDSNVIEEDGLGEDSRMAIENRYEKNENEKKIPIPPIQHKPGNEDSNVIEEHGLGEDSRMATENRYEKNENEKKIPILPIQHKPGNEDSNVIEEHWPDEDSRMAIEKWYEDQIKNKYSERISLNYICIHEHQVYACFKAQDVLQFRLPDDTDYRILAILQEKRDLTNSGKLKKEVEFALQFNMAVLNVQFSEVISSKGSICNIQANDSFAQYENFFKDTVFKIVLPLLALYKRVKLNAFDTAVHPNKESKSYFSERL